MREIILASKSPRRAELIKKIKDIKVKIVASDVDEAGTETDPEKLVVLLARQKAESVQKAKGGLVLGADTVVYVDGEILGKPACKVCARNMFLKLCGKTHAVYTGVALCDGGKTVSAFEKSEVEFYPFDEKAVAAYIKKAQPFDKAGGYGIQDKELKDILKGYTGDLDNIIGLPVRLVEKMLEENF